MNQSVRCRDQSGRVIFDTTTISVLVIGFFVLTYIVIASGNRQEGVHAAQVSQQQPRVAAAAEHKVNTTAVDRAQEPTGSPATAQFDAARVAKADAKSTPAASTESCCDEGGNVKTYEHD